MKRAVLATGSAFVVVCAGLVGIAAPAQAAVYSVNFTQCNVASLDGQTIRVPAGDSLRITFTTCGPNAIYLSNVSIGSFSNFAIIGANTFSASYIGSATIVSGSGPGAGGPNAPLVNGESRIFFGSAGGLSATAQGSFLVDVGGSGGGGSSTAVVPAPTIEIALTPTDGTTCRSSSQSATGGTWLTLPGANDCTAPASKAGATLLGWSTTPNFPVAIAQRQVTNGWGTYETFNSAGEITSVFIPAGRATFLSGANSLYAIWNK